MSVAIWSPDEDRYLESLADLLGDEPTDEWQDALLNLLAGCRPLVEQFEMDGKVGTISGVAYVEGDEYVLELVINKMPQAAIDARKRGQTVQFMRYMDVMEFLAAHPWTGARLEQWLQRKWAREERRSEVATESEREEE